MACLVRPSDDLRSEKNNVLELWSLFDFLMPGYLGTEKQFNALYSKPILASREAKASSQEHEQGMTLLN